VPETCRELKNRINKSIKVVHQVGSLPETKVIKTSPLSTEIICFNKTKFIITKCINILLQGTKEFKLQL
jgi:hypothetical protein